MTSTNAVTASNMTPCSELRSASRSASTDDSAERTEFWVWKPRKIG
jgi:hypothetical protein